MLKSILAPAIFVCVVLNLGQVSAQEVPNVEWLYSGATQEIDSVSSHFWLANGDLLLWENTPAGFRRGITRLDPRTGRTLMALETRAVAMAIHEIDAAAARELSFPTSFANTGQRALYRLQGDLFVTEMPSGKTRRVTKTPAHEESAHFSPDGKKLAFVRGNNLFVCDLETMTTKQLTKDGGPGILNASLSWVYWEEIFGRRNIGYWWSPNSNSIAFLHSDENAIGENHYLDISGDLTQVKTQRYPRAGSVNPKVKLGLVTLADAKTRWLNFGDAGYEYIVRAKWNRSGRELYVQTLNRAQNQLDLWAFAAKTTGTDDPGRRHVLKEEDPQWVNVHDDLYFLADDKSFFWVSERSGYSHLYWYEASGQLKRQLTQGEFALRSSGGVFWLRQAIKGIDEKKSMIYFGSHKKSSIESHLYALNFANPKAELVPLTESEPGFHRVSMHKSGEYYVDEYSNAKTPPCKRIHEASGKVTKVLNEAKLLRTKRLDLVYPEFFEVKARDGFMMPAYLYKPKNFDATKKYPVVMYGYGGPSAPSVTNTWLGNDDLYFYQLLLKKGYLVYCVDNRSATAKSKTLENTMAGQMYGDGEFNDLMDGVAWLKSQAFVDPDRVGLWGWSGGGSLTLLAMTRSKEFRAGIAVAAVTRWEYYDTMWAEAVMKTPSQNPQGYAHCDLVARAKDLSGRLLLVHGSADDNVHVQNAYAFADALIEAGRLFDMMIYPMRKHGISDRAARIHLYKSMLDFWETKL